MKAGQLCRHCSEIKSSSHSPLSQTSTQPGKWRFSCTPWNSMITMIVLLLISWNYQLSTCDLGPLVAKKSSLIYLTRIAYLLVINSTLRFFVGKPYFRCTYHSLKLYFYLGLFYFSQQNIRSMETTTSSVSPRILSPMFKVCYTVDTQ